MIALLPLLIGAVVDAAPARLTIVVGYDGEAGGTRPVLAWADDDAARLYLAALQDSERAWLLTTFDDDSARVFPELTRTARAPTKAELDDALAVVAYRVLYPPMKPASI